MRVKRNHFILLGSILCIVLGLYEASTIKDNYAESVTTVYAKAESNVSQPTLNMDAFPVGDSLTITLDFPKTQNEDSSKHLDNAQIVDWLSLAVISNIGLPIDTINHLTFQVPTSRKKLFAPIANLNYQPFRAFSYKQNIIALLPVGTMTERQQALMQIADEHRKETGSIADSVLIINYIIDEYTHEARLIRDTSLWARALYTTACGYTEKRIENIDSLASFLSDINILTYAKNTDTDLILGGRSLPNKGPTLTTEDVATIWQTRRNNATIYKGLQNKINEYDNIYGSIGIKESAYDRVLREADSLMQLLSRSQRNQSLEVTYNYSRLARSCKKVLHDNLIASRDLAKVDHVINSLRSHDVSDDLKF
jgi:hypothetical protein